MNTSESGEFDIVSFHAKNHIMAQPPENIKSNAEISYEVKLIYHNSFRTEFNKEDFFRCTNALYLYVQYRQTIKLLTNKIFVNQSF